MATNARDAEIRKMVRDALIEELEEAAGGTYEAVFKEAWERCDDDAELRIADSEVRRCLKAIKEMK